MLELKDDGQKNLADDAQKPPKDETKLTESELAGVQGGGVGNVIETIGYLPADAFSGVVNEVVNPQITD